MSLHLLGALEPAMAEALDALAITNGDGPSSLPDDDVPSFDDQPDDEGDDQGDQDDDGALPDDEDGYEDAAPAEQRRPDLQAPPDLEAPPSGGGSDGGGSAGSGSGGSSGGSPGGGAPPGASGSGDGGGASPSPSGGGGSSGGSSGGGGGGGGPDTTTFTAPPASASAYGAPSSQTLADLILAAQNAGESLQAYLQRVIRGNVNPAIAGDELLNIVVGVDAQVARASAAARRAIEAGQRAVRAGNPLGQRAIAAGQHTLALADQTARALATVRPQHAPPPHPLPSHAPSRRGTPVTPQQVQQARRAGTDVQTSARRFGGGVASARDAQRALRKPGVHGSLALLGAQSWADYVKAGAGVLSATGRAMSGDKPASQQQAEVVAQQQLAQQQLAQAQASADRMKLIAILAGVGLALATGGILLWRAL